MLVAASFLSFGLLGYWEESMDTLLVTLSSVGVAVLVGIPLGILIGRRKWAERLVTPVLDVMQTMPTFVYLIPVVLFFGIGTSGAVAATIIYALPPVIRITGHGIRTVSTTTIEASDSLGQTGWQRLRHVQLPMARKTIIVGINQTTMAALSMVVLAAFVNGPGLGEPVLESLRILDIGRGFVPSLAIVIMAIMLDRSTTAASQRAERIARSGGEDVRRRRLRAGRHRAAGDRGGVLLALQPLGRGVPRDRHRPDDRRLDQHRRPWLHRQLLHADLLDQGRHHRGPDQPARGADRRVAVVPHGGGDPARRLHPRRVADAAGGRPGAWPVSTSSTCGTTPWSR